MNFEKIKIPFLILFLAAGIILGIQIEKLFSSDKLKDSVDKFSDVLSLTQKYYVEEVDTQKLVEDAINGLLADLDPHSVYIPSNQLENVEESFRGDFEGIGIEFQVVNDTVVVVSSITGGPSEQLGILPGDRIIKVDGKNFIGVSTEKVRATLRGEAGTKVNVAILRNGNKNLIDYDITRDKIPLYSVDAHLMIDRNTGYISVSRFSETTFDELKSSLADLKNSGMSQLILDLRSNPGGYLKQAVDISDLFIDGKKKIVFTKGRRSEFNEDYNAEEYSEYEKIPLIILINHGSASASEIVAGAIQDWDRGLIVGETSFGKGLVQKQFDLSDNSAIRLTISKYYTPSGRSIQRDYKSVKNKDDYYADARDREEVEGENLEHKTESDSSSKYFLTKGGRKVFGGGGITPDYIVRNDKLTDYSTNLLKNNVFYEFVLQYLTTNKNNIQTKFNGNLTKFNSTFELNKTEVNDFIKFAENKEVKFSSENFTRDKDYILTRIKAEIARYFWKNEGWYSIMINNDDQVLKSLTLFTEAKSIAKLK